MEYKTEKDAIVIEMRSQVEQLEQKKITAEEATQKIKELQARKADLEKREAISNVDMEKRSMEDVNFADVQKALIEKRAIALGANGDSKFSDKVFEIASGSSEIIGAITVETGATPNMKFSLFSPSINNIKRVAEDGTGSTVSTAAFAPVSVSPAPYMGYINVSDFYLKNAPAKLEAKITELFGKGFSVQMAKEVIIGSGSDEMTGVFVDTGITTSVNCAAAGAPKLKDLLALTAKLSGKFKRSQLAIVINPTFWSAIQNEDTKWTYINNGGDYFTFNGVRIIESDDAPTAITSGAKVAVIGNFADYGVAVATDVSLETLSKTAGSLNTPVQGTMYFDGKVIVPSSFATLKAITA